MSQKFIDLIRRGDTKEIAAWVEDDPEIAVSRDAQGVSALMWSIYIGQTVIRDFLLSGLPDLDVFEAAAVGNTGRLSFLMEQDPASVSATSADGWTPLHLAAAFGSPDAVTLLLQKDADVHQRSSNALRNQPLHAVIALGRNPDTVRILLEHGADPNAVQAGGFTPLLQAAASGDAPLIALLLAAGADRQARCDRGKTAADYARERGHLDALALLDPDSI